VFNKPAEELNMITNEYALKFAREAYEDAKRAGTTDAAELAKLKAEYDRQRQIANSRLPAHVCLS
jgi:hypothetical protein